MKQSDFLSLIAFFSILSMFLANIPLVAYGADPITTTLYCKNVTLTIGGITHYNMSSSTPSNAKSISYGHNCPIDHYWKVYFRSVFPLAEVGTIKSSTWTVKYRYRVESGVGVYVTMVLSVDVDIIKSDGTLRENKGTKVASSGAFQIKGSTGWVTKTGTWTFPSDYTVIDNTDYLRVTWYAQVASEHCGFNGYMAFDDPSMGNDNNCQVQNFKYEEAGVDYYYFNFQHHDLDNNVIDSLVTWELYNGTQLLSYNEGEATLLSGTYTLKTYKENHLLDSRDISTSSYGNSTFSVNVQYKQHNNVANGYISSNRTISSITIHSQTAANLTFLINATTTEAFCYIGVSGKPQEAYLNGNTFTSYTYISTTTPKHLYFEYAENGTYSFTFNPTLPPTPSPGGPSGGPVTSFSKRLRITVTNHDDPVQQANVTVYSVPEDPLTIYYQFSDVFGRATFRLKAGAYKILVQHDTLGNRHRTVNLDSDYDLTIEYTDADEVGEGPFSILPQWDISSEQGLLFIAIPIGAVLLYAGSTALRTKRKWKYSYLT
ncbi:MAG: hypothetical protein QXZ70_01120 [Candidatus Bathyarchaeia archaeon]